jgi:DNA polymerase-3 subunit epsilon
MGDPEASRMPFVTKMFAALGLAAVSLVLALAALIVWQPAGMDADTGVRLKMSLVVLAVAVAWGGVALFAWFGVLRPLARLAQESRALADSAKTNDLAGDLAAGGLGALGDAVSALAAELVRVREGRAVAERDAARRADAQRMQLEAILSDLAEGVVVCNANHEIVLYNRAAIALLENGASLGLGRSIFQCVAREPLLHAYEWLIHRPAGDTRGETFACTAAGGRRFVHGRMNLVGESDDARGYVLALTEAPQTARTTGRALAALDDLSSIDLAQFVARKAEARVGVKVTPVGLPVWLHGDSYALAAAFVALIAAVRRDTGVGEFDFAARADGAEAVVELSWKKSGSGADDDRLTDWLAARDDVSGLTPRKVFTLHEGGVEFVRDAGGGGRLCARLPLADRQGGVDAGFAARPEFYDFDLLRRPAAPAGMAARPLGELSYCVFDTETTGLDPADEVVQLAAVRVVNGRILTGETFMRLVDPGRPIPPKAQAIHGIGDADVRGKPPLKVVLPQFRSFVGQDVLIAHNIAFDLAHLEKTASTAGVNFDGPMLDTMLLAGLLFDHPEERALDALVGRFGIHVDGRHTALGDALATAAVLVALIEPLARRGIRTFDEADTAIRRELRDYLKARRTASPTSG